MENYFKSPHLAGYLDVSDIPRKRQNLRYLAPDGSERPFDLYYPDRGEGPFPLIVNICGGGWYYGNPTSIHLGRAGGTPSPAWPAQAAGRRSSPTRYRRPGRPCAISAAGPGS